MARFFSTSQLLIRTFRPCLRIASLKRFWPGDGGALREKSQQERLGVVTIQAKNEDATDGVAEGKNARSVSEAVIVPTIAIIAVVMLAVCGVGPVRAAEPAETYLNKHYWQEMDWGKAESSKLWQMDGWKPVEGKQTAYATFVMKRKVMLLGHEFDANLAYSNKRHVNEHFTSLYAEVARPECDRVLKELIARFGEPVTNDGTMAIPIAKDVFFRMVHYVYQWDIGDTRFLASCSGNASQDGEIVKNEGRFSWSMKFGHRSLTTKLTPRFALTCTRTISYTASGKTDNLTDLVAWFDLFKSRILNADLVIISDKDSFHASNNEIRFSITRKGYATQYRINRISGSLTATITENAQNVGKIAGKCEKTEALVRKF